MRVYILAPQALLTFKSVVDVLDGGSQKSAGSGGGIQYLYFVYGLVHGFHTGGFIFASAFDYRHVNFNGGFAAIRQARRQAKVGFKEIIHCTDDKINHGFRGIPNAPAFPEAGVVFGQEGFIKVNNRVSLPGGPAEIGEQFFYIRGPDANDAVRTVSVNLDYKREPIRNWVR